MARYFMQLSYNGAAYHGWQIQPSGISVQEVLMDRLKKILGEEISVVGAGRTDAGVHASMMIAHFDTEKVFDTESLAKGLNSITPQDIAIDGIWQVADDMHARFSAKKRTYEYYLTTKKNPFSIQTCTRIIGNLDFDMMNEAAKRLMDYTDFTSFSKLHTDCKTNNCKIFEAEWTQISECEWKFTISADRFLRNMVRAIVGTLFEVGRHKLSVDDFCKIIEKKDRCSAGSSAPYQGLFLSKIEY